MQIRVLGSAAGGGLPQWNCGCHNCRGVREGTIQAVARTQESIAVSADGRDWFIINLSPEIRAQIEAFPGLHPRAARHSPIAGILFTSGDLDHCLGLLSLRESHPLRVYATDAMRRGFTEGNILYRTLERFPGQVTWTDLPLDAEIPLGEGLAVRAFSVGGKLPLHHVGVGRESPGENVGLTLRDTRTGKRLAYVSGAAQVTPRLREAVAGADALFFDGTFWSADELPHQGLGTARAADMAHLPVGGADGSLAALADVPVGRRVYIHINNTNPMLRTDSAEHAAVTQAGWQVAFDGMEMEL